MPYPLGTDTNVEQATYNKRLEMYRKYKAILERNSKSELNKTIDMPKFKDPVNSSRLHNKTSLPESPLLDFGDDETILREYYSFSIDNPDIVFKDVMKSFPNVFTNTRDYMLPPGVRYTDLSIYSTLYELSKTNTTLRYILIIQMTNHEFVANYDIKTMALEETLKTQKELMISNVKLLNNKDNDYT
jgi:hypothetical protein